MKSNNIGLMIWGCKGGYKIFCANGVLNTADPTFRSTFKDIRSFVRFNQNRLNVYSLKFTAQYKIYTLYRSCNDSGTGAYVAISLYVPHSEAIKNVRGVLDKMMDKYFNDFVHPLYGTYHPGKYDDIKPFEQMLADVEQATESLRNKVIPSRAGEATRLFVYDNPSMVDTFFETPYRKEFSEGDETMFMASEIYDKQPETLGFNNQPTLIKTVSQPESLPTISAVREKDKIAAFRINGADVSPEGNYYVNDFDKISITFKSPYHKDTVKEGTLRELVSDGVVATIGANTYVVKFNEAWMAPKSFYVKFRLNGLPVPEYKAFIQVNNGEPRPITHSEVVLRGTDLKLPVRWGIYPIKGSQYGVLGGNIDFKKAEANDMTVDLESENFTFKLKFLPPNFSTMLEINAGLSARPFTARVSPAEPSLSFDLPMGYTIKDLRISARNADLEKKDDTIIIQERKEVSRQSNAGINTGGAGAAKSGVNSNVRGQQGRQGQKDNKNEKEENRNKKPGSDFTEALKKPIVWIGAAAIVAAIVLCLIFVPRSADPDATAEGDKTETALTGKVALNLMPTFSWGEGKLLQAPALRFAVDSIGGYDSKTGAYTIFMSDTTAQNATAKAEYVENVMASPVVLYWTDEKNNEIYSETIPLQEIFAESENIKTALLNYDGSKKAENLNVMYDLENNPLEISRAMAETDGLTGEALYKKSLDLADAYPPLIPVLKRLCLADTYTNSVNAFRYGQILRDTKLFDASAEDAIADAEQRQKEEQAAKELENRVKGITDKWKAQLHKDNVSMATVNQIQAELNKLQGKDKELAQGIIDGYIKEYTFLFNDVKSVDDIGRLHRDYYSREQWKILREVYGKGTNEFKMAHGSYGIDFVKTKPLLPKN